MSICKRVSMEFNRQQSKRIDFYGQTSKMQININRQTV